MKRTTLVVLGVMGLAALIGAGMLIRMMRYGFSTHDDPSSMEAMMARMMRRGSVPADLRDAKNPLALTPEVLGEARAHWADHCATCHGNDGKGQTSFGQGMYPKAPDMRHEGTQTLSDGELFSVIENGIRLTGMPGWGSGTAESAYGSWTLVHFIRHLPKLTPEEIAEMEKLNPKSLAEFEKQKEEEEFLSDGEPSTETTREAATHQH